MVFILFPSIPRLLSVFIVKGYWVLSHWDGIKWVFIHCHSANVVYYIDWPYYIDPFLHSWNKSHLVIMCNPFVIMYNSFNVLLNCLLLFFFYFYFLIYLFMSVLGLRFCARAFSSCGKRGPLFIAVSGPPTIAASLVAEHRLQTRRLSNCGSRAQLLRGTWDPPRPGLEPMSPALAGRLSTTAPPGKPCLLLFCWGFLYCFPLGAFKIVFDFWWFD